MAFPASLGDVAALVAAATRVLPVGAQSSLTGGATPRGGLVLSTRGLRAILDVGPRTIRAGAGVPLAELQRALAARNLYFPPVPTYEGAFLGGAIATNAAGAATFKYGSVRPWIEAITVVLADGSVLEIARGAVTADAGGAFTIERPDLTRVRVPVPRYRMPDVAKLSAGYFARPGMDLIDLFIGAEGTLGVVVEATLRVIARPVQALAVVGCAGAADAVALTAALRERALLAWRGSGALDVAGVEYIDDRSLALLPPTAFADAGLRRPEAGGHLLIAHLELGGNPDEALAELAATLEEAGADDPQVALPGDEAGAARIAALREAVPAAVNARVAEARARVDGRVEKVAGDMVVPFERLADSITLYGEAFARRRLDFAVWGHASDGNLHPNVLPRSFDDVERGREALIEIAAAVTALGGAPLAEHGVGRSALKQRFLRDLYGEEGLAAMRAVKAALDPTGKLAPGVLFPE